MLELPGIIRDDGKKPDGIFNILIFSYSFHKFQSYSSTPTFRN